MYVCVLEQCCRYLGFFLFFTFFSSYYIGLLFFCLLRGGCCCCIIQLLTAARRFIEGNKNVMRRKIPFYEIFVQIERYLGEIAMREMTTWKIPLPAKPFNYMLRDFV